MMRPFARGRIKTRLGFLFAGLHFCSKGGKSLYHRRVGTVRNCVSHCMNFQRHSKNEVSYWQAAIRKETHSVAPFASMSGRGTCDFNSGRFNGGNPYKKPPSGAPSLQLALSSGSISDGSAGSAGSATPSRNICRSTPLNPYRKHTLITSPRDLNKKQAIGSSSNTCKKKALPSGLPLLFSTGSRVPDPKLESPCQCQNLHEHWQPHSTRSSSSVTSVRGVEGTRGKENVRKLASERFTENSPSRSPAIPVSSEAELLSSLRVHYGYAAFRPGQLEVISTLLSGRDASVFWATGRGKSLCYQLPALHTGRTAVVVSPLISLMQDQCDKLNGSLSVGDGGEEVEVACYLGSGQVDASIEERALRGDFLLIYLTPEKLTSGNFLDRLERGLASRVSMSGSGMDGGLSVIAIDEAHCVSEWGHDFRPQFRRLDCIRSGSYPNLARVPVVTLTATAVPRVRSDILRQLRVGCDALIDVQSLKRDNLLISVHRKPNRGGFSKALMPWVEEMKKLASSASVGVGGGVRGGESTIIYAPTKSQVEEIATWLSSQLSACGVNVAPYHAGLPPQARHDAHTKFLVGQITVIVATIAFGMGIDKPDIRRVMHYGPPKTTEEYYQQIGRAGRDGLTSTCVMWANDADFSRYGGEFYVCNLSSEVRDAVAESTEHLRKFAVDETRCRRIGLLEFFGEKSEPCGTCDNCLNIAQYGDDTERDLADEGARVVLTAVGSLRGQGISFIEKVIKGNVLLENYRYQRGMNPEEVRERVRSAKEGVCRKFDVGYYTEMIPPLVQRGFLTHGTKTAGGKYKTKWSVYDLTPKGRSALRAERGTSEASIIIPVPAALREMERVEEEKRLATLAKLESSGIDLAQIPKSELEVGDGEVIKAHKHWLGYLESLQRRGRLERIVQLEGLRGRIEVWRNEAALKYRMAPASVMSEHLIAKVAYVTASSHGKIEAVALREAGVRTAAVAKLVSVLSAWKDETAVHSAEGEGDVIDGKSSASTSTAMIFPGGSDASPFAPAKPWNLAVYKPNKKTGLAAWESSHQRFLEGESPQTIAMSPASGRAALAVSTVIGHIMEGLVHGRPVPLGRLAAFSTPPTKEEWETLHAIERSGGNEMDVTEHVVKLADFLTPVMGVDFAEKPYDERSEEERIKYRKWIERLKWYQTLRRIGYVPSFENDELAKEVFV